MCLVLLWPRMVDFRMQVLQSQNMSKLQGKIEGIRMAPLAREKFSNETKDRRQSHDRL